MHVSSDSTLSSLNFGLIPIGLSTVVTEFHGP